MVIKNKSTIFFDPTRTLKMLDNIYSTNQDTKSTQLYPWYHFGRLILVESEWSIIHFHPIYIVDNAVGDHIFWTLLTDITNIEIRIDYIGCFVRFRRLVIAVIGCFCH